MLLIKPKAVFYIAVIPLLLVLGVLRSNGQGTSNKGTEFWTSFMEHIAPPGTMNGANMVLYITSDVSTTGKVEVADGSFSQNFSVTANQVTFIGVPASAFLGTSGKFLKGIHITALSPVAVYAHIYANNVSGATLLLPVNTMGKDYVSLNYTQLSNAQGAAHSVFTVVATEDNTTVAITPVANLLSGNAAGVTFNITLQKGEVYQGLSLTDLTGTKIQSISTNIGVCKKIAVFSGSSKIAIGCITTERTSDNLFQQVYPIATWGKNYVTTPLASRKYDIFRVVLSDPATTITVNGVQVAPANGIYEFSSTTPNIISADKPIQVVQYSLTQNAGLNCVNTPNAGDPEMIYLSPVEQGLDHVTLYSTGYFNIDQSYINVVLPAAGVASFTLDGMSYSSYFNPVPNDASYAFAQIPVSSGPKGNGSGGSVASGTHTIKSDVPFNAIAYGFGNVESYGYAAGTNLQDLNEYVAFQDPNDANAILTSACSDETYKLQVTIPYQTTNISWNLGDGNAPYVDNNPIVKSTVIKNNKTLYNYEYPTAVNYTTGSHKVIATVFNPVADVCGSSQDIQFDFMVNAEPVSIIAAGAGNCLGDNTLFKDASTLAPGSTIKNWLWDFGDNTSSTQKEPTHLYATAGNYNVRLTITDNNGCSSVSPIKVIHIKPAPVASFTVSSPDCATQNVTLTSTAVAAEGNITNWDWDFGDGLNAHLTDATPVNHIYSIAGSYTAKLTVTTDLGCVSAVSTQTIVVNPIAVVNFVLPDVCLSDSFAQFNSTSTIADNTEAEFTYLWNFGDANSTPGNPNTSTLQNPKHKYSNAGNFTVTLTITSKYGCITTKSQQFTVNGAVPVAKFDVENKNNLCSSNDVLFVDQSIVDFGSLTKLVWYFDYTNNPANAQTFTGSALNADRKYSHNYGLFNSPASKNFKVRLEAYSGQSCVSVTEQNIVVNTNPVITLSLSSSGSNALNNTPIVVCGAELPFTIYEIKGTYTGMGKFTGTGISSGGLFNAASAGPGTHTINYLFTTDIGCMYSTNFTIVVNPTPIVAVTPNLVVLSGGQIKLAATASISAGTMTYKWSPSTGLDHDDVLTPVATPLEDMVYTLVVKSDQGCDAPAVQVAVKTLLAPVIPNTFTPNGDGINDTWDIKYLDSYPNSTVEVFNRYGERMFTSNGYSIPWDGRFKGSSLPTGTYYYMVNPKNGRKIISGYIAIVR